MVIITLKGMDLIPDRNLTTRKRMLVTGGAGFLGSHLCERLLAAGHDAVSYTHLDVYKRQALSLMAQVFF